MQVPRKVFVLLVLIMFVSGFFTVRLFTDPDASVSPEDVLFVTGHAKRVEHLSYLQFWVEGHHLPFRIFYLYGDSNREALEQIQDGMPVKVGTLKREQNNPPRAYGQGQDFLHVCFLELDGQTKLSLDAYNHWHVNNDLLCKILVVTLLLGSIGVLVFLIGKRKKPISLDPSPSSPRPPTLREFLLVGLSIGGYLAIVFGIQGWNGLGWASEWADPGIDGLLVGIASGFIFGMGMMAFISSFAYICTWARQIKNKRLRFVALALAALLYFAAILVFMWQVSGWNVVFRFVFFITVLAIIGASKSVYRRNTVEYNSTHAR